MDEVRCPMCSTLNPAEADECRQCGARLKPVTAGPSTPRTGPLEPKDLPPVPDWLNRMRSNIAEGEEEPEAANKPEPLDAAAAESPDWLGRLREAETPGDEGPPAGEVPDWLTGYVKSEAPTQAAPLAEPPKSLEPPKPAEPPAKPAETSMAGETPEWLSRIRDREAKARLRPADEAEDDWLSRFRDEAIPSAAPAAPAAPAKPAQEKHVPSRGIGDLVTPVKKEERPASSPPLAPPVARRPVPVEPPPARVTPTPPPAEGPSPEEIPAAPPAPPIAAPAAPSAEEGLPKVPALIMEGTEESVPGGEDLDISSIKLPDWMSDLKGGVGDEGAGERPSRDLAPATIPAWLEAMRPIDTFRSVVEIQSEEEQSVEAAGPLAGLRGVLLAEPVVAMPRAPGMDMGRVDVTERHYAQAELLQKMLEEEAQEAPGAVRGRRRIPILRWAVAAVVLLAVAIPAVLGSTIFPPPSAAQWPPELVGFRQVMDRIPADRAALLIFDYEPGPAGEMEAVLGPVVDDLMARGVPLATLSTKPTGGALAERILARYASLHGLVAGGGYVHLGFLPGGATAAQSFLLAPRLAWGNSSLSVVDPWSTPSLAGVQTGADFGAVFLVSAGAESARVWVEQASTVLGTTPLLAVVSAGVEPILRPYHDSQDPRLDALASGLPMALAYEQANGRQGDALSRWNPYGAGMLAAEALLAGGTLYGLAGWLLRRRIPA